MISKSSNWSLLNYTQDVKRILGGSTPQIGAIFERGRNWALYRVSSWVWAWKSESSLYAEVFATKLMCSFQERSDPILLLFDIFLHNLLMSSNQRKFQESTQRLEFRQHCVFLLAFCTCRRSKVNERL